MDVKYKREDISKDKIQIEITIPKERFQKEYSSLLKKELEDTNIKGFRKGKVPSDLVEPHVGHTLKIQAFENLLPSYLEDVLLEEKINPIAPPEYKKFPSLKEDEDLTFTMEVTVMPEFKLGNLKKIKIKQEEIKVEKKEIDSALDRLKESQKTEAKEINEEWAQEIIKIIKLDDIKNLKELREHIREAMLSEKKHLLKHQTEDKALQEAIKISNIEIPQPAVKYEAQEREKAFISDMQQKGIEINDFLKANNITMAKMREMWDKDAQQALQTDVFLNLYAQERNIEVSDEEVKKKIEIIRKGAPEKTDPKIFEDSRWREYIKKIEQKEKAFQEFIKEVIKEEKSVSKKK